MSDRSPSTEELALAAFEANERVQMLGMRNMAPLNYEERKKSSVEYALAQEAAMIAQQALDARLNGTDVKAR